MYMKSEFGSWVQLSNGYCNHKPLTSIGEDEDVYLMLARQNIKLFHTLIFAVLKENIPIIFVKYE